MSKTSELKELTDKYFDEYAKVSMKYRGLPHLDGECLLEYRALKKELDKRLQIIYDKYKDNK